MTRRWLGVPAIVVLAVLCMGASSEQSCNTSDDKQREQNEALLQEATAQTGMPAIKNFRERKLLKDILETRDQDGLATYTYLWSEMRGTWVFLCDSAGYGIPYATQYTNPEKYVGTVTLPQADPNGLFSPAAAEGTWVQCLDPGTKRVRTVYVEPRVIVSPYRLDAPKSTASVEKP